MRTDLYTGEKFTPKRKNQLFASPKNRIAYNNNRAHEVRKNKSFVDKPLQQNYKILAGLLNPGETKAFSKDYLNGKGYNFNVLSHYEKHDNKVCQALYSFVFTDFNQQSPNVKIYRKK